MVNQFIIDYSVLELIEQRVNRVMALPNYADTKMVGKGPCQVYGDCGCGVGGTCANSCVSGCAERGGCGPHGPR